MENKNKQKKAGKKTGAWLIRYALEQLPVRHTFGIPGVHVTELYDELNLSKKIEPVLVTHESGAAFMADAVSRTSDGIGTLAIVPAAGVTHAMSGIGEAYLDGIPMLILSGGVRTDIPNSYQLHQLDQMKLVEAVTKKAVRVTKHSEIVSAIFDAYQVAVSGEPGPVFIEIPVDIQLLKADAGFLPAFEIPLSTTNLNKNSTNMEQLEIAVQTIAKTIEQKKRVGIFTGWGAKDSTELLIELAELLAAPVSVTLQGLSVFPSSHPLHTGMGFSKAAVPAAENAFKDVDCLIAVATRFSEIPTGSFGAEVPEKLIHIDINKEVFDKNYPSIAKIEGDAAQVLSALIKELRARNIQADENDRVALEKQILLDKKNYVEEFRKHGKKINDKVNAAEFFLNLRKQLQDDAITVVDDGNHTFLTAELFEVKKSKHLISPTDFNCMGYCVPAAIGAKFANPQKQVVGIVGDGAFLMTAMEILTASTHNLGVVWFVFYDGELSQISQGQEIPYNRKTCTILGDLSLQGVAQATGALYLSMENNSQIEKVIAESLQAAQERPVIVDVKIDYSKRTRFTQGVVKTVLKRFPLGDKFRFIGRALTRKIGG